jgi:rhomboid family GlyGly-CTERM serine protease
LALLLGLGSVIAWPAPKEALEWQPARVLSQPWRAWTAAWVHYSGLHLGANLAGLALVAALGQAARVPLRCTAAWLLAWPATQWLLVFQPQLLRYGGLSGVLHAAVAIVVIHLLVHATGARRLIAAALASALLLKLAGEAPWQAVLRRPPGWNIDVAPGAHVTGVLAGVLAAALVQWIAGLRPGVEENETR